jgi:hypothetical protein
LRAGSTRYAARVSSPPVLNRPRVWLLCAVLAVAAVPQPSHAQDGTSLPAQGYPVPSATPGGVALPSRSLVLQRVLGSHLDALADHSGGRILDGTLELVLGGAFVGVGIFVKDELFRSLLFLTGGVSLGRGLNQMIIAPDPSEQATAFQAMPTGSIAAARARLKYGEDVLAWAARRARTARLIDGTLTMAGAAGYVPLYWGLRRANEPRYRFGDDAVDYLTVVFSTVAFAAGLITTIRKSEAEQRQAAYRELKDRFRAESPAEFAWLPRVSVGVQRQRAMIAARWTF